MRCSTIIKLAAVYLTLLFVMCTTTPTTSSNDDGSGTKTGNPATVVGMVQDSSGAPVVAARVTVRKADYLASIASALSKMQYARLDAVTNDSGAFHIDSLDTGSYVIEVNNMNGKSTLFTCTISSDTQHLALDKGTLSNAGSISGNASAYQNNKSALFVQVYGLERLGEVSAQTGSFVLLDIPAGHVKARLASSDSGFAPVLLCDTMVKSTESLILPAYNNWKNSAAIILNTTSTGANIAKSLYDFPVLIRLTKSNFDFGSAKQNGEDIRFVHDDYSPLSFEIEDWDSTNATASVWVRVDSVLGSNNTQGFTMLWGNPAAKAKSNSTVVFDTVNGYRGVWHLQQSGGTIQKDATVNRFTGTPTAMTGSSDVTGIIARSQDFDGSSQCITVLNARNSALDVQVDSQYTVSAWLYVRTLDKGFHVAVTKGSAQYGLMVNKQNRWEFYGALKGYGVDTTTTYPATLNTWTFVTGVRQGMQQYLYVNGVCVDSTNLAAGVDVNISNNSYDFVLGRQSDDSSQWFDGLIDEVTVAGRARSSDWIALSYQNQRSDQVFVTVNKN